MHQRQHYISLARIIAAICIITLHTVETYGMVSEEWYWIEANIIVGIAESAVPVFFMITGATLLDYRKRYSTKEYFRKRLTGVVIPLAIWYGFAQIYRCIRHTESMVFPYWFFFVMVGMYLCIPLFSAVKEEIKDEVFLYVICLSFLLNYLAPFVADVFDFTIKAVFPFDVGAGYLVYVLVGYLLHKKEISSKWRIIIYVFACIGFVLKVGGTYVLSLQNGSLDGTFGHYTNVPCFLLSVGVFVLLKQIGNKIKKEKVIQALDFLSGCTMASYVMHQYVSAFLIRPFVDDVYSLVYNLGVPVLNFLICVGITCVMRKIPLIKKLVP